eukprot:TRINITY_DN48183_c0_g2_i2.p1 TRINITY_DN48183_c0_g2~~TRINITY_DN48183_c0_g2_i2.p1  ORF type:complete len:799 (-),score=125.91 TRINITY_DN48183_c0_g2_i2:197-2413(-)
MQDAAERAADQLTRLLTEKNELSLSLSAVEKGNLDLLKQNQDLKHQVVTLQGCVQEQQDLCAVLRQHLDSAQSEQQSHLDRATDLERANQSQLDGLAAQKHALEGQLSDFMIENHRLQQERDLLLLEHTVVNRSLAIKMEQEQQQATAQAEHEKRLRDLQDQRVQREEEHMKALGSAIARGDQLQHELDKLQREHNELKEKYNEHANAELTTLQQQLENVTEERDDALQRLGIVKQSLKDFAAEETQKKAESDDLLKRVEAASQLNDSIQANVEAAKEEAAKLRRELADTNKSLDLSATPSATPVLDRSREEDEEVVVTDESSSSSSSESSMTQGPSPMTVLEFHHQGPPSPTTSYTATDTLGGSPRSPRAASPQLSPRSTSPRRTPRTGSAPGSPNTNWKPVTNLNTPPSNTTVLIPPLPLHTLRPNSGTVTTGPLSATSGTLSPASTGTTAGPSVSARSMPLSPATTASQLPEEAVEQLLVEVSSLRSEKEQLTADKLSAANMIHNLLKEKDMTLALQRLMQERVTTLQSDLQTVDNMAARTSPRTHQRRRRAHQQGQPSGISTSSSSTALAATSAGNPANTGWRLRHTQQQTSTSIPGRDNTTSLPSSSAPLVGVEPSRNTTGSPLRRPTPSASTQHTRSASSTRFHSPVVGGSSTLVVGPPRLSASPMHISSPRNLNVYPPPATTTQSMLATQLKEQKARFPVGGFTATTVAPHPVLGMAGKFNTYPNKTWDGP